MDLKAGSKRECVFISADLRWLKAEHEEMDLVAVKQLDHY